MTTTLLRLALPALAALLMTACASAPPPPPAVADTPPLAPQPVVEPAPAPVVQPAPAPAPVKVAEAEPAAIDTLRPQVRIDLNDETARTDLWSRVRQGFAMNELDNDLVRKWEQWYAARPDYVQRMTERGGRYLFHIVEELAKRNMPTELALLPFIESAYNPEAMSRAKASGMWQFVPGTGRDFALKQNVFRDDRRDVLASTRAALDYLQTLHTMFGDWQLALAAYNWGQGNVQRALTRSQKAGLPGDYTNLRMPDETRNYLPKLQAVKNIVLRPEAFALALPVLQNHPYFLSVPIQRDIDVDLAARLAGLSLDEFRQLNPQMNKPVILAAGTPQVLLPYDNANTFVRALSHHKGTLASWTAWVAPKTLKPAEAARHVGMSEPQLREVNRIPSGMLVKVGSTLLVPRDGKRTEDVSEHVADNAMLSLAPDRPAVQRVSFKAGKKGDSVAAVARRYKLNPAQVAQWNKTTPQASFKPGQPIVVMLAKAPAAAKSVRVAVRPASTTGRRLSKPAPAARTRAAQN
ncbi:MAG: transglycosylase SLT domain-containing protein [Burkholderiales bacterium]|nr:transglycosylase SLT domain-containing protein [Burkholderiales bacterium]